MMELGLHAGYWWGTGLENDYDAIIRLTRGAGVEVIEVTQGWMLGMDKARRRELAKKFADAGLRPTVNGGLLPENDISADDAAVRKTGVEYCKRAIEAMADVGVRIWSGVNFSAWLRKGNGVDDPQEERKRAWAHSVASLRELAKTAEAYGVNYCVEVVNRYEQFLFNTAAQAVEFVREVDSPGVTILLDAYHMHIEEDDPVAAIRYAMEQGKLGHFHVGESNRRVPGTGPSQMDWPALLGALKQSGFSGAVVMEPFVLPTAHNAGRTCTWRQMAPDTRPEALMADAATGYRFLKQTLQQ